MAEEFQKRYTELIEQNEPFAWAVVVRCTPPTSAKPGAKGIILADGTLEGWIGGGCAQPVVIREGVKSIKSGIPKLIRIMPLNDPDAKEEDSVYSEKNNGVLEVDMACYSGGTLEIYVEPAVSKTHLIILGRTPVAMYLAKLASAANFTVSVASPDISKTDFPDADIISTKMDLSEFSLKPPTFIVVATQGEGDEDALEQAIKRDPSYLSFVASRTKSQAVFKDLIKRGISEKQLEMVKVPAGIDIGAVTPEEIAVSILAEIIQVKKKVREAMSVEHDAKETSDTNGEAIDPICGMTVDIKTAKHISDYKNQKVYFCCTGCKDSFDKEPEKYAEALNG